MRASLTIILGVIMCTLIMTGTGIAQEYTGERIRLLVDEIDSSISRFESETANYDDDKAILQNDADNIYNRLTQATDQLQKESNLADLLYNQAQQHRLDWNYIQATKGTLFELVPRLSRLAKEVERASRMGFTTSGEYEAYRSRLESFLNNSSQILRGVVQTVDDPELKKNIQDAAIALKSARFGLSGATPQGTASISEVHETVRLLENSIAQLQNIENSLLAEKFTLQLQGYRSMVRLVISRLDLDGPLAMDQLPSFVDNCVAQIQGRNGRLNSAVGYVEGFDPAFTGTDYITDDELESLIDEVSQ